MVSIDLFLVLCVESRKIPPHFFFLTTNFLNEVVDPARLERHAFCSGTIHLNTHLTPPILLDAEVLC